MAAGGGGGRGGLGWVILAAALAVPGFLFWNWWSHLKAERDHAISAKATKRAEGTVFQTPPPSSERLINPMAASTGAAAGFPPSASTGTVAGAPPAAKLAPGAPPAANALPGTAAAAPGTPPAAASSAVTLSSATVVLPRDPMMSPLDLVHLREAAMAEEDRQRALREASRPAPVKKRVVRVKAPIQTRIELQGIVAKSDGDNIAIINGSTINPGESFAVESYPGKVRIIRITSSEVTLEYSGKKFKLSVSAE